MNDPIEFTATTARHALPYLIAGQAQKEFFVNEALARLDTLVQPVVSGTCSVPPTSPPPGDCWIVDSNASGNFAGQFNALASWDGGQWTFFAPFDGMRVFDASNRCIRTFNGSWSVVSQPAAPAGGTVIDAEARDLIATILDVLRAQQLIS